MPKSKPLEIGILTKEQFDAEPPKGMESARAGRVYSADSVEEEINH